MYAFFLHHFFVAHSTHSFFQCLIFLPDIMLSCSGIILYTFANCVQCFVLRYHCNLALLVSPLLKHFGASLHTYISNTREIVPILPQVVFDPSSSLTRLFHSKYENRESDKLELLHGLRKYLVWEQEAYVLWPSLSLCDNNMCRYGPQDHLF